MPAYVVLPGATAAQPFRAVRLGLALWAGQLGYSSSFPAGVRGFGDACFAAVSSFELKDMVLKFSGSGKQYRAPTAAGSPSFRGRGYGRHYPGFIDDTSFTPTHRPAAGDVGAGAYASRTGAAATNNGSVGAASSATWDITGRGWPGIDEEEDGGVRVDVDAAVPREWMAQVEPGVQITFVTLPGGGNDLKRIRFSREMFNKWEAQRWWGENYDRIVELYNVQTFSGRQQAGGSTPNSSVDDSILRDSSYSRAGSTRPESPVAMMPSSSKDPMSRSMSCKAMMPPPPPPSYAAGPSNRAAPCYPYAAAVPDPSDHVWAHHFNMLNTAASGGGGGGPSSYDPSRATTSSRDEASVSISNASDMEAAEWIEQDEPGVCLTIRELGDGTRELRRVRFSRERFGEDRAKVWWEQNRDRIQAQYL